MLSSRISRSHSLTPAPTDSCWLVARYALVNLYNVEVIIWLTTLRPGALGYAKKPQSNAETMYVRKD